MQDAKVIDVDSHFFEPFTWLASVNPTLAEELSATLPKFSVVDIFLGEVLASLPPDQRAEARAVIPLNFLGGDGDQLTPAEAEAKLAEFPPAQAVLGRKGAR